MRKIGILKLLFIGVGVALVLMSFVSATASSANISRSFHSSEPIPEGSIVSFDPGRNDYVKPANTDNGTQLVGVAVESDNSLLAVNVEAGKLQVATSGSADTLVSTLNGDIKSGDLIAVSPFSGIGMKAPPSAHVIGAAATDFDASSSGGTTRTVTDKDGNTSQVYVGFVSLSINIGTNSTGISNDPAINGLQKLVKSLTGRVVPTYRVVIAMIVIAVALITLVTLTYGSIYGSIISIGRNPLAKYSVFRTLGSVIGMIAMTALTATMAVFLLLR